MNKKFICSTIAFFSIVSSVWAQAPKYSNEFLNIGVGARALGMGNANVASVEGVNSGYWNPAGLLKQKNDEEAEKGGRVWPVVLNAGIGCWFRELVRLCG